MFGPRVGRRAPCRTRGVQTIPPQARRNPSRSHGLTTGWKWTVSYATRQPPQHRTCPSSSSSTVHCMGPSAAPPCPTRVSSFLHLCHRFFWGGGVQCPCLGGFVAHGASSLGLSPSATSQWAIGFSPALCRQAQPAIVCNCLRAVLPAVCLLAARPLTIPLPPPCTTLQGLVLGRTLDAVLSREGHKYSPTPHVALRSTPLARASPCLGGALLPAAPPSSVQPLCPFHPPPLLTLPRPASVPLSNPPQVALQ